MPDECCEDTSVMRQNRKTLSQAEAMQVTQVKDLAHALYIVLDRHANAREIRIAKTKLEECVMWATKYITA